MKINLSTKSMAYGLGSLASVLLQLGAPLAWGAESPALKFAKALDSRRNALDWDSRKKAELNLALALQEAGLHASAHRALQVILADSEAPREVRMSALEEINSIERKLPSLVQPKSAEVLPESKSEKQKNEATLEWLFRQFQLALAKNKDLAEAQKWAALITPKDSPHARLAQSWMLAFQRKPAEAYPLLVEFLRRPGMPEDLQTHLNANRILAARLAYAIKRPAEGAQWLRAVDKKSNLAPTSLEELTWSLIQADAPGEAVGTALQLQKGLLLRAFVPEAAMVQAMALNEACHFPSALKTIERFKRKWEAPYQWIGKTLEKPKALIHVVRNLLKEKKGSDSTVPTMIGWELIRSPRFVSNESLRVELEQTPRRFEKLREQAREAQLKLAHEILAKNEKLSREIRNFRERKPDADLPLSVKHALEGLRDDWKTYRALRKATGPLAKMAQHSKSWGKTVIADLTIQLEGDLQRKLKRMHGRLEDVLDNLNLMEIEILDGASRDLVWQNAHPDFAVEIKKEIAKYDPSYDRGATWSWGSASAQIDASDDGENEEIWEDELGSHGVALADRCDQKDRYLALKRKRLQASN